MANKLKYFKQNPGNAAFCYYRYSSDAQRDVSIEQQKRAAHEYAEKNGYVIVEEFEDRAKSGTCTENRPGLQHMLYEIEHKHPACLIVWKTDRLSRSTIDANVIRVQLWYAGVKMATVAEALPEDEALKNIFLDIYAYMAQNFIEGHTKNVLRGLNYNAQNALFNGHKILGYKGESNKRYEIDEETAPIVKKIFTEYAEGKPLQKIADELNEAGLRTVKGNKFVVNSLAHILRNRAYIGEYKYGEYCIEDGMPRIISDELFYAAEKMLQKNRRGGKKAAQKLNPSENDVDFWLTSHIYCGECGAPLHGTSGTGKSGKTHYYYTCLNHKKHKCSLKNKKKKLLESIVEYVINKKLQDPFIRLCIAEMCYDYYQEHNSDNGAYLESLKHKLKTVNDRLNNFARAIGEGIFNKTTQQAMCDLENQKHFLEEQIETEELKEKYDIQLNTIVRYFDSFYKDFDDVDIKQRVLDLFVDKILIYEDKIVIAFHFLDDNQELSYKEMEETLENEAFIMSMMGDTGNWKEPTTKSKTKKKDSTDFFQ